MSQKSASSLPLNFMSTCSRTSHGSRSRATVAATALRNEGCISVVNLSFARGSLISISTIPPSLQQPKSSSHSFLCFILSS
eukprot:08410_4